MRVILSERHTCDYEAKVGEEAIDTSCAFYVGHLELPHLMLTLNPSDGCMSNQ